MAFDREGRVEANKSRGGWRRYLLSWIRSYIELDGWLGWDVDDQGVPNYVMLEHVRGKTESSDICIEWDDLSTGVFGYRDHTSDGIPFVNEGDLYWSGWWFQFKEDAVKFQEKHGGFGTWQEEYDAWQAACNRRRDGG